MASKRSTVTWKIPAKNSLPTSPKKRTIKDDHSEKDDHSVTYEHASSMQDVAYSDTFVSDSYSDTFVTSSSITHSKNGYGKTEIGKPSTSQSKFFSSNFLSVKTKSDKSVSVEESEMSTQEATHLETARNVTDALETVQEISPRTDEFETFSGNDISDTHPPSYTFTSYTDTFESEEQTTTETQAESSDASVMQPSLSKSYGTKFDSYSSELKKSLEVDENLLDKSCIAPDFNGKLLSDEEDNTDDGETLVDDYSYSYTFEPTVTHAESKVTESSLSGEDAVIASTFLQSVVRNLKKKHKEPSGSQFASVFLEEEEEEDASYLKHYCKKKMKLLKTKKKQPEHYKAGNDNKAHPLSRLAFKAENIGEYGVPESVMERAKLKRIMSAMKKAATEDFHEPRKCQECSLKKLELDHDDAQRQFVRAHTMRLKNKAMDARVEEHLLKMNTVSLVAELARDLPRHSDKPEKVLDRLLEPLLGKNVMR